MRIAVIGATGTIGAAVSKLLKDEGHDVIEASRTSMPGINIDDSESIEAFYEAAGDLEAIVCAAGNAAFGNIHELSDREMERGIKSKLMGQVNLVRKGIDRVTPGGVFILTSGMLSTQPWPSTSAVAMVNAALEGFTRAAALDLGDEYRLLTVSPPLVQETAAKMATDPKPWPQASIVAKAYLKALSGDASGEVIYVDGFEP